MRRVTEIRQNSMLPNRSRRGAPSILGAIALLLAASCGKDHPDLGGRGDTAAPETAQSPTGLDQLAYVTNEDSQELSVIDTRTDSVVASIPVGTRPRGVRVARD